MTSTASPDRKTDFTRKSFFLMPGSTDMRKSMHTLSIEVHRLSGLNPFDGNCYIFLNKRGTILKMVYWSDGQCMFQKYISDSLFFRNRASSTYIRISTRHMIAFMGYKNFI